MLRSLVTLSMLTGAMVVNHYLQERFCLIPSSQAFAKTASWALDARNPSHPSPISMPIIDIAAESETSDSDRNLSALDSTTDDPSAFHLHQWLLHQAAFESEPVDRTILFQTLLL